VLDRLDRPSALIAPSMGGLLALQAALVRPDRISHLVLTLISGGLPMAEHGAKDWRETFQAAHPALPDWYATADVDRSGRLASLPIPTLRLWGDGWPHSCPRPLWWSFPAGPMIWRWRELPRSLR
jgi:pimeloyl-ACP methyl ester carboxylesterase